MVVTLAPTAKPPAQGRIWRVIWISSAEAGEALHWAETATDRDPLRLGAALVQRFGLSPAQRAAVLTQVDLRARAAQRWHTDVTDCLFTRDGLEQASRPAVAAWRAQRLAEFGVRAVADLGCGLGFESRAMADAGLRVTAVEIDSETAALAEANLANRNARVLVGDITNSNTLDEALHGVEAVFLDPARRDPAAPRSIDGLSGHRISEPEQWSPKWSWITSLAAHVPRTVVKVAPGIDHALIPDGGSAVWTSIDGDLVEASIWFPSFKGLPHHAANAMHGHDIAVLDSSMPTCDTVTPVSSYLLDVAPVVTRSGLVTTLAHAAQATRIDEHIGYLTCEQTPEASPFYTAYRVLETMPFDRKRIADSLHALGCGSLTVMKRGFAADTEQLRKHWLKRCNGSVEVTVALTRIGDAPTAIICTR